MEKKKKNGALNYLSSILFSLFIFNIKNVDQYYSGMLRESSALGKLSTMSLSTENTYLLDKRSNQYHRLIDMSKEDLHGSHTIVVKHVILVYVHLCGITKFFFFLLNLTYNDD